MDDATFIARLTTLLATVPPDPARPVGRFTAAAIAAPPGLGDTDYVAALAILFRVPVDYFTDAALAAEVDARVRFTRDTNARGVRFFGPCRTRHIPVTDAHDLHMRIVEALDEAAS